MENVWLIMAFLAVSVGYVVFELHHKFKLYEDNLSELKSHVSTEEKEIVNLLKAISRLDKKIEDLRMETNIQTDQERTKTENLQKELLRLDSQMEDLTMDFTSQLNGEKKKIENLRMGLDYLRNKQEVTKVKMDKLNTDVKIRDDILKDLDDRASSLHNELQNTVKETEKLLGHVTNMDKQILNLVGQIATLSKEQQAFHDDYTGGRLILNSIKAGLNLVFRKLLEITTGGLFSINGST